VPGVGPLAFDPDKGVAFDDGPPLPGHANGLVLRTLDADDNLHLTETYYSIGAASSLPSGR
jgi:L-serine dehydratase